MKKFETKLTSIEVDYVVNKLIKDNGLSFRFSTDKVEMYNFTKYYILDNILSMLKNLTYVVNYEEVEVDDGFDGPLTKTISYQFENFEANELVDLLDFITYFIA